MLADIPQAIDLTAPPIGANLTPYFPRFGTSTFPADRLIAQRVVLVGHVEDPLSIDCPHLGVEVCRTFFVVDRIAWIDGENLGPRVPSFVFLDPRQTRSPTEISRVVRGEIPGDGTVQSITALDAVNIGDLDPTVGPALEGRGIVWYVRAVERGTNRVGSFIVDDASRELLWSAFPMPMIEVR